MCTYPGVGLVFDYMVDFSRSFPPDLRGWGEMVPSFTYNKQLPFFQVG